MSAIKEDYILRMIEMMGEVIVAALKLKKIGQFLEADQTLGRGLVDILPEHADLVEMVDENTAISLLGNSDIVEAYVELLLEQAEVKMLLDQVDDGEALQARAIRLLMGGLQRQPKVSPKGQLIWGRIAGLELKSILDQSDYKQWEALNNAFMKGLNVAP
ncbi:MAG: hypothetical protein K9M55_10070 [Candidatus Marinimicrobia bacterium]|nr:hypothetical protein [Candidatus Neomarinimicrobiota bacterium]MCF7923035.1 hypothetical protein [Candidatus Neomarinimicrobiota bacterium]